MKTAFLLLIIALGYMWFRGDFDSQLKQPDSPVSVTVKPAPEKARITDAGVKDKNVKPLGLEVFEKEKSSFSAQQKWLESHRVKDEERTLLDKFHNFASTGKWE